MTEFPEIERLRKHAATLVNGRAVWLDDAEQAVRDAVERVRKDHTHVSLEMWHAARREAIRECVEALRERVAMRRRLQLAEGSTGDAADFLLTLLDGEGSGDE